MELGEIKGVGTQTLEKLKKLGIESISDALNFLPKSYLDMSKVSEICQGQVGEYVLLEGEVSKISKVIHGSVNFFRCMLACQSSMITLIWFNAPYLRNNLVENESYFVWGKLLEKDNKYIIYNPSFENSASRKRLQGIVPIYPIKKIVGKGVFSKIIAESLNNFNYDGIIDKTELIDLKVAYQMAHFPQNLKECTLGRERIFKENLVTEIIAHRFARGNIKDSKDKIYAQNGCDIEEVIKDLPYALTKSQHIAIDEILQDMDSVRPMNRMLSGDVGSGKTIVALLTMCYAIFAGHQCAFLAPTSILAIQHYETAVKLLKNVGIRIALILGNMPQKDKKIIKKQLISHEIDMIVGTHALLTDDVIFDDLTYIVVDELHKFGVRQKASLLSKAKSVDALIMSATPIPRVVALVAYGDITLSELDTRKTFSNVATHVIGNDKLYSLYGFIKDRIKKGESAYIVCPLVEDSEGLELYSAKAVYDQLKNEYSDIKFGLVYGKQDEGKKQTIMSDFMAGKIDCLVATSVVEVGVDCKRASVMAVLNSERFGLASLHQLRGRVGRDPQMKAYCFLHTAKADENARLLILRDNFDGKVIAEEDARMRGYGDFLGICQSGGNTNLVMTKEIVCECNAIADKLMENNSTLFENCQIARAMAKLKDIEML